MRIIGNFVWFIFFGGWFMWPLWLIASLLMFLSIIGIPFGRACWNLSEMAAAPVGKEAINRYELTQKKDIGTSPLALIGNIIWFLFAGIWLALAHIFFGIFACITILGIPFGIQHFKLAGLVLMPIGKAVVSKELAQKARDENAKINLEKIRSGTPIYDVVQYDEGAESYPVLASNTKHPLDQTPTGNPSYYPNKKSILPFIPIALTAIGGIVLLLILYKSEILQKTYMHIFSEVAATSSPSKSSTPDLQRKATALSLKEQHQSEPDLPLEGEYEICKGLDTSITSDMMSCLGLRFEAADKELNKVYKELMRNLNEVQKQELKRQQTKWIKNKEKQCPLAGKEVEGGTMESVLISDCFVTRTEKRLSELKANEF